MSDDFNAAPPPPGHSGTVGQMPPPPPPMGFPVMMPAPRQKRSFASRLADALLIIIFAGSLVMNVLLFLAVIGLSMMVVGSRLEIQTRTLIDGNADQQIAVIDVKGLISDETVQRLAPQFDLVLENDTYKALLLRVSSPGGGVGSSDTIAHMVRRIKEKGKPVVVLMGGVAASGGYYISAPADYIMAGPTTITGSIGVLAQVPNVSGSLEKIGAKVVVIPSTPATRKTIGSPFLPWDPANRDYIQKFLDAAHERFVQVIYDGRTSHFPDKAVLRALADGAALTAAEAKAAHLIDDDEAYFQDAVDKTTKLAGLTKPRVVRLSKMITLRDVFGGSVESRQSKLEIDASLVDELTTPRLVYLWQGQ